MAQSHSTQRGWVNTSSLPNLDRVSRDFHEQYGVEVTAYTVLRSSKGGWTQIEAVVTGAVADRPDDRLRADE
jgi:hypothetical protein